jgi:transposase
MALQGGFVMSILFPNHESQPKPTATTETEKLIRKVRQYTRKKYSAEEKIRIVMEGIKGDEAVSMFCRREGIHANLYYKWLKEFMEGGKSRLKGEEKRGATLQEVEEHRVEIDRLKQVVADLSVENLVLKKSLL